jgi:hypothetical protein
VDSGCELFTISGEHELEELSDGLGILLDLFLCVGVQDGKAGIHVPLVRVDAEGDVLLDVFDATDVAARFPWELVVGGPCGAHAEEGGMRDGLCVRRDAVVLLGGEVDVLRSKTGHDILDKREVVVGCTMLDQDQRLPFRVDARPVEGVHGNDADVLGQVFLKGIDLGSLARGLTADDGADLGSWAWSLVHVSHLHGRDRTRTKRLHDGVNVLRLDAVDYEVAAPGDQVAVLHDLNVGLAQAQYMSSLWYVYMGAILQSRETLPPAHRIYLEDRRH